MGWRTNTTATAFIVAGLSVSANVGAEVAACAPVWDVFHAGDALIRLYTAQHGAPPPPQWVHERLASFSQRDRDGRAVDPWGRPYVYRVSGATFDLFSVGKNGREGDYDDIRRGAPCEYVAVPWIEPRSPFLVHRADLGRLESQSGGRRNRLALAAVVVLALAVGGLATVLATRDG